MINLDELWKLAEVINNGASVFCHPDDLDSYLEVFDGVCSVTPSNLIPQGQIVACKPEIPTFSDHYYPMRNEHFDATPDDGPFYCVTTMTVVDDDIILRGWCLTVEASRRFVRGGFTHLHCDGVTTAARVVGGTVFIGDEVIL